jgi:hypothetical protein
MPALTPERLLARRVYSNATKDFEVFKSADPAPDHSSLEPESWRFFVASVEENSARGGKKEGTQASGKPASCRTSVNDILTILANIS